MNVLSLFDGMSGGQIALTNMGVKIDTYYASEIDKHAIAQTQLNFPNTKQLGSVTEWQTWDIDWSSINILFAGSPCQGFSFAGKQLAFDDPRSKLFFVFVDILNHIRKFNPNVLFLLENVKMKAEHESVITQYVGVNPIEINSALLSAQNRVRLYWTNIGVVKRGLFDEYYPGIPQPKDKGILLRDILESDVPEKYYLSEKMLNYMDKRTEKFAPPNIRDENGKSSTITVCGEGKQGSDSNLIKDFQGLDINKKSRTLRTGGSQSQDDKHNWDLICVASRGRNPENPKSRKVGLQTEQQLEPRNDGKTNCLTSVQKDNLVMCLTPKRTEYGKQIRKQYEAGEIEAMRKEINKLEPRNDNKTNTLSTVQKDNLLTTGYRIRRLTPTECARLQTIPTWYKWQCSDTQQYRMLGNGWTNDVIEWILSFAKF
jgi:DNA-cytosine methyltransferase